MSQYVYIPESAVWTDKIRMLQTKDPVLGGKDGPANWAPQDLANRTAWLKFEFDKFKDRVPFATKDQFLIGLDNGSYQLITKENMRAKLGLGNAATTDIVSVLGTSKTLAASQFLVNEVSKSVDLVGIQVTKNTKELENKLGVGEFGFGKKGNQDFEYNYPAKTNNTSATQIVSAPTISNEALDISGAPASNYAGILISRQLRPIEIGVSGTGATAKLWYRGFTGPQAKTSDYLNVLTTADLDGLLQVPVGELFIFHTKDGIPPAGFIVRNGQPIDKTKMPKLYEEYGTNMPDDRNLAYRNAGDLTGAVGTRQEDAIQNITGALASNLGTYSSASGAFRVNSIENSWGGATTFIRNNQRAEFDASLVARTTEDDTRVKSRIIIGCNKIQ